MRWWNESYEEHHEHHALHLLPIRMELAGRQPESMPEMQVSVGYSLEEKACSTSRHQRGESMNNPLTFKSNDPNVQYVEVCELGEGEESFV